MITGHTFLPGDPDDSRCDHLPEGEEDFCYGSEDNHLIDRQGTVRPHPAHLRNLVNEGGGSISNTECLLPGCGALRLAKVHEGFKPVYDAPAPVTEVVPDLPPPPIMLFGGRVITAEDTIPAVVAWDAYAAQVRDLIVRKSRGYGNAWQEQGYMGNLARVLSKASRLKNIAWREAASDTVNIDDSGESVMDTLHDLGALCAFLVANIEEGNRWGR